MIPRYLHLTSDASRLLHKRLLRLLRRAGTLGLVTLALSAPSAHAAPRTWNGSSSGGWGTSANWTPATVPVAADTVTFNATGANFARVVLGAADRTVTSLTFAGENSYNIFAGTVELETRRQLVVTGGITVSSGSHTITGRGASGLSADLVMNSTAHTFSVADGASLTLDSKMGANTASVYTKTGLGRLVLGADNGGDIAWDFSGAGQFSVSQGTLVFKNSGSSGNPLNKFSISGGATLELAAEYGAYNGLLTLNGSGHAGTGALYASESVSAPVGTGSILLNTTASIGVAGTKNFTINMPVTGPGGLTKIDAGNLTLGSENTYSGATVVTEGKIILAHNLALRNSRYDTAASAVESGLDVTGFTTPTLGGLVGSTDVASAIAGYSGITALTLNPVAGVSIDYSGAISDGAPGMNLTKTGAGTQLLAGENTYTGTTTVSEGTLHAATLLSLPGLSTPHQISVGNGATLAVNAGGPGEFTTGNLGLLLANADFNATSFLGIDTDNAPGGLTYAGDITDTTGVEGSLGLTKLGDNTLTLAGANTYSGGTSIHAGTLALDGNATFGATTNSLALAGTATADLGGTSQAVANLNLLSATGTSTLANGSLAVAGGAGVSISPGPLTTANVILDAAGLTEITITNPFLAVRATPSSTGSQAATFILSSAANTLTVASLNVGTIAAPTAGLLNSGSLLLGTSNTIEADAVQIGITRGAGNLSFQSSGLGANPSVTFRGAGGGQNRVANFLVGLNSAGSGDGPVQHADFSLGSIDGRFTDLTVSRGSSNDSVASVSGSFTMQDGTVDATNIVIGDNTNGGRNANNGVFTQKAGAVTVATLTLGRRVGSASAPVMHPVYQLGTSTSGALLKAQTIQAGSGSVHSSSSRSLVWNNGTIRNYDESTDLSINGLGPAVQNQIKLLLIGTEPHIFHADADRTITVDTNTLIQGSGGLTKEGAGTLVLSGTNTYTGDTTVSGGKLSLNTAYLADDSTVSIAVGATLDLNHPDTDLVAALIIDGTPQAGGIYDSSHGFITGDGKLEVLGVAVENYSTWATANGIDGEPATGDFDGDGLSNLVEYALGLNPTAPSVPAGTFSGGVLNFAKGSEAMANGDVTFQIETSTSLETWTVAVENDPGESNIFYTLPSGLPKVFVRLKVTLIP